MRAAWVTGIVWSVIVYTAAGQQPVTPTAVAQYEAPGGISAVWSPDGRKFVWRDKDVLHLYDVGARQDRELLRWKSLEDRAQSSPKEDRYAWVNRGAKEKAIQWFPKSDGLLLVAKGDLFQYRLDSGETLQLTKTAQNETNPILSPDGRHIAYIASHDLWVLHLGSRRVNRLTTDGTAARRNGELDWVYPEELDLGTGFWWSPDSRRIAFLQFDQSSVQLYPHADLTGLRPVTEPQRFPQAGTPNPLVRVGLVLVTGGKPRWLTLSDPDDLIARVDWKPDGSAVYVMRLNRIQNRLTLSSIDPATSKARRLVEERDPAWVNVKDDYAYAQRGNTMIWGSERSGYRHLYLGAPPSTDWRAITSGSWEITDLACVDETHKRLYYVSTEPSPLERQVWTVGFDGSGKRRLSTEKGLHAVNFSPDCTSYLDTHSSLTEPPMTTLRSAAGKEIAVLRTRDESTKQKYRLLPSELVSFRGADGTEFFGRLMKPLNFDPAKHYPAVVNVYGGPHAQVVSDRWRGLDWHQALAQAGFVVWEMDNRGSAYRGHDWEAKVFRRFGKQELADQLEGVRYLKSLGFVDPDRIGITGWSFGGFMTLYSMLNAPKIFRAGVAGAPVTDWRDYDTIYTERYLGLPNENEDGYKASSPIHQAQNLAGSLMLVHNFEDDNVLFQHTMRMMNALQQAGKQFDLMLYPQKTHHVSGKVRAQMLEGMTAFFERTLRPSQPGGTQPTGSQ